MCMRCGKRTAPRRGEQGCTCRAEKEECIRLGKHGVEVREAPDAVFPDYIHRTCRACGMRVEGGSREP